MNSVQLSNVDLNLLVLFDVVWQERHVGRAAKRLSLSASAVSHGLGRLRRLFADPLFLRTPKGVVPTERATTLQASVADVLARIEQVVAASTPFTARTSKRRFTLGMADSTSVVLMPALLTSLRRQAPFIDVGFRHIFPNSSLAELEARAIDVAVTPVEDVPARFTATPVCQEQFVIAARKGHPFLNAATLKRYCEAEHVLASLQGDARGFIDEVLESRGLSRRISVLVSNFMQALAALEGSQLLTALPLSLASGHAARFGAGWVKAPLPLRTYTLSVVATRAAMQDAGTAWLFDTVVKASLGLPQFQLAAGPRAAKRRGRPKARS